MSSRQPGMICCLQTSGSHFACCHALIVSSLSQQWSACEGLHGWASFAEESRAVNIRGSAYCNEHSAQTLHLSPALRCA